MAAKCWLVADGDHRIMTGRVVMLPDPKRGGLKSRTFYNVTFGKIGYYVVVIKHNGAGRKKYDRTKGPLLHHVPRIYVIITIQLIL